MRARRLAAGFVLTAVATGTLIVGAGAASALSSYEQSFVSLINQERSSRGIGTLAVASDLVSVARNHSEKMAAQKDIFHNGSLGSQVSRWWLLGENVGMGPKVSDIHRAFMNSPGHRANILERDFNQVGVGVVVRSGTIYVTEVFAKRSASSKSVSSSGTSTRTSTSTSTSTAGAGSAPAPRPRPKARPKADPQTVDMLVRMVRMDADPSDPATGRALG